MRNSCDPERFFFRGLHSQIFLGTASDRYAGWIGQIYAQDRYYGRIKSRTHTVGGKKFKEEVLPVDSVSEYFDHFRVLEVDYTFYRPLIDENGKPESTYSTLRQYALALSREDRLLLKVPQSVFAQKLRRGSTYVTNEAYLNPELFTRQFYEPAEKLLGPHLAGFIFEQEYQAKGDRLPSGKLAESLDKFFQSIPKDDRYHVELRTESYLVSDVFQVLDHHRVGQVLSHWTWLPSLSRQFQLAGERFFNPVSVVRLLTPRKVRYEDAYARAYPFDRMVEGMMQKEMVEHTVELMRRAVEEGVRMHVIVNNRAGGNAPMIARELARVFLDHPAM